MTVSEGGKMSKVLIVGASGKVGSLLRDMLLEENVEVVGVDLSDNKEVTPSSYTHITSNIEDCNSFELTLSSIAQSAQCIIVCLPERVAEISVGMLLDSMAPHSLLLDTLSVKTKFIEKVNSYSIVEEKEIEVLSINPMFSPDLGISGNNIIAVNVRSGIMTEDMLAFFRRKNANFSFMSVEAHDYFTAITQAVTHAAILSFGMCLSRGGYSIHKAVEGASPPHLVLLALLSRILSNEVEVYWDIQTANPYAASARKALIDGMQYFDNVVAQEDFESFKQLFESLSALFGSNLSSSATQCSKIFNTYT
jgi:4-amino-4-deoxyprephenate dehydrogenase